MRLDSQNITPRARRKAVYAGANEKSYGVGAKSLQELAEWKLIGTRVSELTLQAGKEMKTEQSARVEAYHPQQATRSPRELSPQAPANLPQVGVVEMDGGRIRTRQENNSRGVTSPHWREFQAGCVVRLQSEPSTADPRPDVPGLFLSRPKVQKLVSQLHRQRTGVASATGDEASIGELLAEPNLAENMLESNATVAAEVPLASESAPVTSTLTAESPDKKKHRGPVRLQRTCVATLEGADACGRTPGC